MPKLPIGVSIYPLPSSPARLKEAGAIEVKFNLETATEELFAEMCPGLVRQDAEDALRESVPLFGRDHVFSNIILGLGETDDEMSACIERLCRDGIIPVIRPLTPGGDLKKAQRPDPQRILKIFHILEDTGLFKQESIFHRHSHRQDTGFQNIGGLWKNT